MRYLLLILLPSVALGASQKYVYKDPKLDDEITNIYKYLNLPASTTHLQGFTKAQLQAKTPRYTGELYYCSDCTTDAVVVSTGTTISGFGRLTSKTTAPN